MAHTRAIPSSRRGAFTLIELLVVIAVIAVLMAILLPALGRSRTGARQMKCAANLHSIGTAFAGYLNDNRGVFPVHSNWGNVVGKKGTRLIYDEQPGTGWETDTTASGAPVKVRPLNRYLGSPLAAKCPDDRGDCIQTAVTNCYESYGTSYLVHWDYDSFATAHATADTVVSDPMREWDPRGPMSRKLVMAEWVWHGNRPLTNPQNLWHNVRAMRQYNILFADTHVALFAFPREIEGWYEPSAAAPDPARGWW